MLVPSADAAQFGCLHSPTHFPSFSQLFSVGEVIAGVWDVDAAVCAMRAMEVSGGGDAGDGMLMR